VYILTVIALLSTSHYAFAQSDDWMTSPEERSGLTITPNAGDISPFGPYMDGSGDGILEYLDGQHRAKREQHMNPDHWYDPDCCSGKDCKPYATNDVILNIDGSISVHFNMQWMLVDKSLIKVRPPNATHDELWHVCIVADEVYDPYPVCAYPPDITS
jgi:hypothetical protein